MSAHCRSRRILVVEDEAVIALDIRKGLLDLGYLHVSVAETGEDALIKIAKEKPDLVMMDIGLSGAMDGIDTALEIKKAFPDLPVLFVTSYSNRMIREKADLANPSGYVLKPFSFEDLDRAIVRALECEHP